MPEISKERLILYLAQINDEEFTMMILHMMHTRSYPYKSSDTSVPVRED